MTGWGAVVPRDGSRPLDWYVAADDRWHVPAREATVRQSRVAGTAVVETRMRVPSGDVVQRVYSVADGGGFTVVEFENDSPLPVAVAVDRRDVRTERPPSAAAAPAAGPDAGIPADAFVLPLGHRATVRVALAHDGSGSGRLPDLPSADQVARGWRAITDRASRLELPPGESGSSLALDVVALRCELALGEVPAAADDPVGFAVGLGELVRMGEPPDPWLPELVEAVEVLGPRTGWAADVALAAAGRVLHAAGERRALADLGRLVARRESRDGRAERPSSPPVGVTVVPWLEQRLADGGALLPDGVPNGWWGADFEVHGVPAGPATTVSYAIRWHGQNPAVLWELTGEPVELSAPAVDPSWQTDRPRGEALWRPA